MKTSRKIEYRIHAFYISLSEEKNPSTLFPEKQNTTFFTALSYRPILTTPVFEKGSSGLLKTKYFRDLHASVGI